MLGPAGVVAAAAALAALGRRITRKGTDTVGGGSEALRLGPAQGPAPGAERGD